MQAGALFVGRERELATMLEALEETRTGRGRILFVGGEPGIGKSRIADELATRARDGGHQVLWGRGWEGAGAPAYWPWVQALRAYLRSTDPDELRVQLGSGARDIAPMLPELRDLVPDLPPPGRHGVGIGAVPVVRLHRRPSCGTPRAARPLLIVLDDLHAADTPSILLLRFVASQMADMRVLLVGTYRDVELTPDHPLTAALAEVAREPITGTLALTGLPVDAVEAFIRSTADVAPHDHLVAAVWRETNGNPLFVGEAVRLLSAEGRLNDLADLPSLTLVVPAGVRAVIARRVGHLSEGCGQMLGLAAALGPEFSCRGAAEGRRPRRRSSDRPHRRGRPGGSPAPVTGARARYRFSHDLVRETLSGELSPGRRARLHRRIAEVLEDVYASSLDAHLAELALHYIEAARSDGATLGADGSEHAGLKATAYARRAGDQAARSLAYEEADRLYRMALAGMDAGQG